MHNNIPPSNDFFRNKDETLCRVPSKYIEHICDSFEIVFYRPPNKHIMSYVEKNDHSELDITKLLDLNGLQQYQSLIVDLQGVFRICRFDIQTTMMTFFFFSVASCRGYIKQIKRVYGYLPEMKHAVITIRTSEHNFSDLPTIEFDLGKSVYGNVRDLIPTDAHESCDNYVTIIYCTDANYMHCMVISRFVTSILTLLNQMPIDRYIKCKLL